MLHNHGCGKETTFTLKNENECCSLRPLGCNVLKEINSKKDKTSVCYD